MWTSWDEPRTGNPTGQPFDPFDPFAPFRAAAQPQKTPQEALAEVKRDLQREGLMIAGKVAVLLAAMPLFTVLTDTLLALLR